MRRLFGRHVRLRRHHRRVLNRRSVRRRRRRDVRRGRIDHRRVRATVAGTGARALDDGTVARRWAHLTAGPGSGTPAALDDGPLTGRDGRPVLYRRDPAGDAAVAPEGGAFLAKDVSVARRSTRGAPATEAGLAASGAPAADAYLAASVCATANSGAHSGSRATRRATQLRSRAARRAAAQPGLAANVGTATKSASRLGACTARGAAAKSHTSAAGGAAAQPGGHSAARTGMGPYARTTGCPQGGGLRIGMPAQGGAVTTQDAAPTASPEAQARTAGCTGLTANSHTAQRA
ncbi:hypothetical protein DSM43519_00697 [Mycobacterium marinum]|nr:hypothetical protein CCUG20998_00574 [Mycobacterium marinum]RFZ27731.1 hypothetical protein DSM43519_00697 [Mycobacterium marinum]RFZ29934.1 hypothetical protein DSM44344_00709 [Mycobacterium marinum]